MKKGNLALLLICALFCMVACSKQQEMKTNSAASSETIEDEYSDANSDIRNQIDEETLSDYTEVRPIIGTFENIPEGEKIWCKSYTNNILIQTDLSGKIYDKYLGEDAKYAQIQLTEDRILFQNEDIYYIYDFKTDADVTQEYTNGEKEICYASNECLILSKVEETYNYRDIHMYILDNNGNEIMSFSINDMSQKYNVEWDENWGYGSCGAHIYYIEADYSGSSRCFIDLKRKKAFLVSNLPSSNAGWVLSDGEYITDYQPLHGQVIINCDTEQVSDFKNGSYNISGQISEGKIFCTGKHNTAAYLNIDGSVALDLNYEDTTVTEATQFKNGYAMLEFNDKFITIINEKGEFLFEPVEGRIASLRSINGTNVYFVYKQDEYLYRLSDETGQVSKFATIQDSIYTTTENGQEVIVVLSKGVFSTLSIE